MNNPKITISKFIIVLFLALTAGTSSYAQKEKVNLSFNTTVKYGSQKNNLSVWASSDFSGDNTLEAVGAAKWIDITKRFSFASGAEAESSGNKDISDVIVAGKPLYIAFKYIGEASERPTQRGWGVQGVAVTGKNLSKTFDPSDFKFINSPQNHEGAGWSVSKTSGGVMYRSNQSLKASESWAIIKVIE